MFILDLVILTSLQGHASVGEKSSEKLYIFSVLNGFYWALLFFSLFLFSFLFVVVVCVERVLFTAHFVHLVSFRYILL